MRFHVLTLFPEVFTQPLSQSAAEAPSDLVFSIVARAVQRGQVSIEVTDIRDHTHDAHGTADDYQFGGGHGMVMKPEPVFEAAEAALSGYAVDDRAKIPVILTTPQGEQLTQRLVEELSLAPAIAIICGHYAGVDERIAGGLATREISIGDYVLTGGELPAMIIIDAVTRLVPGVVGSAGSVAGDSITTGLLQHPLYTRPAEYRGMSVPDVFAVRPPRANRPLASPAVPGADAGPASGPSASGQSHRRGPPLPGGSGVLVRQPRWEQA